MVREIMIDKGLAKDAEIISEALGYSLVEHYIMDVVSKDIDRRLDMVRMIKNHQMITNYDEKHAER